MPQNALPQLGGNTVATYYYFEITCYRILLGFNAFREHRAMTHSVNEPVRVCRVGNFRA
jgi:hypothetical protein